jgi:hypothetical protein
MQRRCHRLCCQHNWSLGERCQLTHRIKKSNVVIFKMMHLIDLLKQDESILITVLAGASGGSGGSGGTG